MAADDDIAHLLGPWIIEFNPIRGWTTQCERCEAPLVVEAALYPTRSLPDKYEGAVCDACAADEMPERFGDLCAARDRHLAERPFEER